MTIDTAKIQPVTLSGRQEQQYRWHSIMTVVMVILANCVVSFHRNSAGVLKPLLESAFGLTSVQYATFSSMYFYPYVAMQLVVGALADTIGPRRTIGYGMLLASFGAAVFSFASSFPLLCLGRAIVGMGVSAPIPCSTKLYSSWFRQKKVATTIGVGQGVGGAFSAVIQVPLAMAVGIFGWRYAYRGIGIGTLLIGILVLSLMKDAPEDAGLPSIEQLECRRRPQRPKQNFFKVVCAVYRNPWTWPYLILMPIHMGLYNMFASTWAIPYITEVYGKTTVEATTYTMMMMLGLSAAMLVFPILSDRTGNRKMPMLLLAVITALTWLGLAFFSEWIAAARVLPVFMVGMGVTQGIIPLFFTVVKELNDPAYGGNAVGSTNMIGMLGSAVLPVIVGGVMDRYKVGAYSSLTLYRQGFTLCLILSLLALVCVFFTKETHCENIYHLKGPSQ